MPNMQLILPKIHPVLEDYRGLALFFLAGPVAGAGDWHHPMSELLMKRFRDIIVANPSWYGNSHPHMKYRVAGENNRFERTVDWERHYLSQAAEGWPTGCVIFWLAEQKEPREDGEPYARDTRGELGEWRGRLMHNPDLRVVVGAEEKFPGLSVIKRNFQCVLPHFKIYDTMEEVVDRAAHFAHPKLSFAARVGA